MGRPLPYRPMHAPRKEVSQERMAEILAKHSHPKVEVAVQSPQAKPAPLLKWKKPVACSDGSVYLDSECGHYRIERREKPQRLYYVMTMGPEFRFELGRKATADEAKECCETEARSRATRESVPDARCGDGAGEKGW